MMDVRVMSILRRATDRQAVPMTFTQILTLVAAIGSGIVGGIFLIFSTTIIASLERLPVEQTVAGMQAINRVIQAPIFLLVFMGTALVSIAVVVTNPGSVLAWIGAVLYVLGTFGLTMVFNVPLNNALAKTDPVSPEAQALWTRYLSDWTWWNHVRTIASTLAFALFIGAIAAR
jgi:uncharacterized membrane protein